MSLARTRKSESFRGWVCVFVCMWLKKYITVINFKDVFELVFRVIIFSFQYFFINLKGVPKKFPFQEKKVIIIKYNFNMLSTRHLNGPFNWQRCQAPISIQSVFTTRWKEKKNIYKRRRRLPHIYEPIHAFFVCVYALVVIK